MRLYFFNGEQVDAEYVYKNDVSMYIEGMKMNKDLGDKNIQFQVDYLYARLTVDYMAKYIVEKTFEFLPLMDELRQSMMFPCDFDNVKRIVENKENQEILNRFMAFTDGGDYNTIRSLEEASGISFDTEFKKCPELCLYRRFDARDLAKEVEQLNLFAMQVTDIREIDFCSYDFTSFTMYESDITDLLQWEERRTTDGIERICHLDKQKFPWMENEQNEQEKIVFCEEDLEDIELN